MVMPASQPPPIPASVRAGKLRPCGGFRCRLEAQCAEHGRLEQQGGDDQKVDMAERHREPDGHRWPQQRAGGPAGGDEAKQPLALLRRIEVGHERPEHRDGEQVEHADPYEEHPRNVDGADVEREQQPEDRDIQNEEVVDEGNETPARQLRDECAEHRHHR
jgi:hypothetical protein